LAENKRDLEVASCKFEKQDLEEEVLD